MASELRVDKIIPTTGAPTSGGGGIVQVVHATATSQASQNGNVTAFVDTGLSASITPKFSTSKILVTGYLSWYAHNSTGNGSAEWNFAVCDNSNNILDGTGNLYEGYRYNELYAQGGKHPINFLHSPSTTSAFTYKMRMNARNSNNTLILYCQKGSTGNNISRITLMEVSA